MRPAKIALLTAGLATLLAVGPASAGDSISAEALFQAGREAAVRGDYRDACDKFAESQRLDPAPGTLINLGDCNEHLGLFASAWRYYREAIDRLPGDKRVTDLRARVAAIEPRLSRLTIKLAPSALASAKIIRDEVEIGAASLGLATPIDPGEHVVVVTAPGREAKRYTVKIVEGQAQTLEVELGAASRPIDAPPPPPSPPPPPPPPPQAAGSGRVAGIVIGSLGVASLATTAVTGVMTIQRKSTVKDECPGQVCRSQVGIDAASQGKTLSLVSTITFATGLVGLGVGAYLVISSGAKSTPAVALVPTMAPGAAGLEALGRF